MTPEQIIAALKSMGVNLVKFGNAGDLLTDDGKYYMIVDKALVPADYGVLFKDFWGTQDKIEYDGRVFLKADFVKEAA